MNDLNKQLIEAINNKDFEQIKNLIAAGADLFRENSNGLNPYARAIALSNNDCYQIILEAMNQLPKNPYNIKTLRH